MFKNIQLMPGAGYAFAVAAAHAEAGTPCKLYKHCGQWFVAI